jgi:acylphosphatase
MRTVRVRIAGHVQGVFFRASCADLARELGIDGWVRNRPDGDIEAVFQGPDETVDRLLEWCRTGPPAARVDTVEVTEEPAFRGSGFRVSH